MKSGTPSRTALRVAMRRAAHQVLDRPLVLDDPVALWILGSEIAARVEAERRLPQPRAAKYVRAFMVARSRFAEDALARAVERGVSQFVVLGAGLDTFAYRNPYEPSKLHVFEVDYPATQAWKQECLRIAGITAPESLTFVPVDFETLSLAEGLAAAGFDKGRAAFFSWLGVTMYLTPEAMDRTLGFIASLPKGSGAAFDYAVPRESLNWLGRFVFDRMAARVAAAGEPFRLFFAPDMLAAKLRHTGFSEIEDAGASDLNARYFEGRRDGLRVGGKLGRIMHARV